MLESTCFASLFFKNSIVSKTILAKLLQIRYFPHVTSDFKDNKRNLFARSDERARNIYTEAVKATCFALLGL